jgi:alpha-glucosidase (family GH31 glycosyl hydrolase)
LTKKTVTVGQASRALISFFLQARLIERSFSLLHTGYTWSKTLFPDPRDFLKQLHDRDLKATLNLHPADGVRHFEDAYVDMCKALGRDPEGKEPIPFEPENRKFMDAYFDILHRRLEDEGVDFWVCGQRRAGYDSQRLELTGLIDVISAVD